MSEGIFTSEQVERLRSAYVDPDLLAALVDSGAIHRVRDLEFEIPHERPTAPWRQAGSSASGKASHPWDADGGPRPWGERPPASWWPLGKDGSVALIVVGAYSGLALSSLLFHVDEDGNLKRRPQLPGLLADAVPVVLPETCPFVAVEWVTDSSSAIPLATQLAQAECSLAILAMAGRPSEVPFLSPALDEFSEGLRAAAYPLGIAVAHLLLPCDCTLMDLLVGFNGHGRRFALAGILESWAQIGLRDPIDEGGDD